ncbi:MAG: MTAP family purine nucleoside phosphorylase [Actinomycetota bacterium]
MTLGLVVGSALHRSPLARDGRRIEPNGIGMLEADGVVVLPRHGRDGFTLPHRIDHGANLDALVAAGVDRILAVSSVGSLRPDWPVGTCVLVDDFYAPAVNVSRLDDARAHCVPAFDPAWRAEVAAAWRAATATPIAAGGVYAQTRGPRFETPAEIRALARVADLVGMTVASECILASERGLPYAALCVVDNFANGIGPEPLTVADFHAGVAANLTRLLDDLAVVVPTLAGAR